MNSPNDANKNFNESPRTPMQRMEDSKNGAFGWTLICIAGTIIWPLFLQRSKESYGVWYYLVPVIFGILGILSFVIYLKRNKKINQLDYEMASFPSKTNLSPSQKTKPKNSNIKVFFSYVTKDAESFRLKEIATQLENFPRIEKVFYWERDTKSDIVQYMEENLENADVVVLFCSQHIKNSNPVKSEYGSAMSINKAIIPVFVDINDIPVILRSKKGVQYNFLSPNSFPAKLRDAIISHLS
ncbi:toll/interleukin-1 receptor domain-containing protein [Candidatus Lokiarchaeum ossiferum]|uniref:toll/interleukin-1 receptor domain-containing protein n=1 Tax=Candidatus Lokiarchaeum ossiferum TaxID=2951803 RepID=UPI00352EBA9A